MTTLPPELSRFAHLPHIRSVTGGREFSSACPVCGEHGHIGPGVPDRFRMWPNPSARGWCRRCGHFEWADSQQHKWTEEQVVLAIKTREELARREQERLQTRIKALQEEAIWRYWHDNMRDEQRQYWTREGIPPSVQDWFWLGFVPNKSFTHNDKQMTCPALSIPYLAKDWCVSNIQFRLLTDNKEVDKYRFTYGLPTSLYWTEPEKEPGGVCIMTEGVKKGIVTWLHVGARVDQVGALPSKTPNWRLIEELRAFDRVYLMLDPDAYVPEKNGDIRAHKIARAIGENTRLVRLPMKVDDMLNMSLITPTQLWTAVQQGRRVTQ